MLTTAIERRPISPSIQKYGTLILQDGFTQYPRSVEDYLNHIKICSTAIRLILVLMSHRWQAEQELFPSVRELAERCGVTARRINQLTAQLCALGLLVKTERFAEKSQLANCYDIEPLFRRVAAWKSVQVALTMDEEESQTDAPFEPADALEQEIQSISERFGESDPRQIRYNICRLDRRWSQNQHLEWPEFTRIIKHAVVQTEERRAKPTRTGKAFEKLVPYFFSSLDYKLRTKSVNTPTIPIKPQLTTQQQDSSKKEQLGQRLQQPTKKSGLLTERAQARKEAEADGQRKVHVPETLKIRIEATALTFRDKQVKSSIQRAANLMADAQLDELTMCQLVADARAATSQATNVKNRMPYFFSILEEKIQKMLQ